MSDPVNKSYQGLIEWAKKNPGVGMDSTNDVNADSLDGKHYSDIESEYTGPVSGDISGNAPKGPFTVDKIKNIPVDVTNIQDGEGLVYDSTENKFKPGNVGGSNANGKSIYTTPGSYTFTVPMGVTELKVVCIGGGGGGGAGYDLDPGSSLARNYCGGGGGGFCRHDHYSVYPGQNINLTVGQGGSGGQRIPTNNPSQPLYIQATAGTASTFGTLYAGGGGTGTTPYIDPSNGNIYSSSIAPALGGTAHGGEQNISGGDGDGYYKYYSTVYDIPPTSGACGGGGGGMASATCVHDGADGTYGGGGGGGAYADQTYGGAKGFGGSGGAYQVTSASHGEFGLVQYYNWASGGNGGVYGGGGGGCNALHEGNGGDGGGGLVIVAWGNEEPVL